MNRFFLVLFSFFLLSASALLIVDLYVKNEIEELIDFITPDPFMRAYSAETKKYEVQANRIWAITLEDLLIDNYNGIYAAKGSHKTWKNKITSNPDLAHIALRKYGKYMLRQINSRIGYEINSDQNKKFLTTKIFWLGQKQMFSRYMSTINKLLLLSDEDLNYFISTNNGKGSSYEFKNWCISKNIIIRNDTKHVSQKVKAPIENTSIYLKWHEGVSNYYAYPGDLFLLTKRSTNHNPEWTPRSFLLEARRFGRSLESLMEELNYW